MEASMDCGHYSVLWGKHGSRLACSTERMVSLLCQCQQNSTVACFVMIAVAQLRAQIAGMRDGNTHNCTLLQTLLSPTSQILQPG